MQRRKEEASDYRYFPEPDIPPMKILRYWDIKKLRKSLPELPDEKLLRFIKQYSLSEYQAGILTANQEMANYFEKSVKFAKDTSGVTRPASPQGGRGSPDGERIKITPKIIANWLINKRVDTNKISPAQFVQMILQKTDAGGISEQKLKEMVEQVLFSNQKAVSDYKKGKEGAIMFLVGKVMQESGGKANPQETKRVIELLIKNT